MRVCFFFLSFFASSFLFGQNIGINNTAPNYPLDIAGDINFRSWDTLRVDNRPLLHVGSSNLVLGIESGRKIPETLHRLHRPGSRGKRGGIGLRIQRGPQN